jgi:dTDP-D-glucose 4,6-dehydratase
VGSTDKAAALLDWRARTRFEDGLERTVAWYCENEAWWRAILGSGARAYSSSAPVPPSSGCSRRRGRAGCS